MAEQASPVLLDEDQPVSADEPQKKSLAEAVASDPSIKLDDSPPTTDVETGLPRISIGAIPARPEVGVSDIGVDLVKTDSVIPLKPRFKTLEASAKRSLEQKALRETPVTPEQTLSRLNAGEVVTLQSAEGQEDYGPEILPLLKSDPDFAADFQYKLDVDSALKESSKQEVDIAFTDPSATKVVTDYIEDPSEQKRAKLYAENRMKVNNLLKPLVDTGNPEIDTVVRQYFVDHYDTGKFFDNLNVRLTEASRGMVTILPYMDTLSSSFGRALGRSIRKGTPLGDEWSVDEQFRNDRMENYLDNIETVLPGPTAARHFNNEIRKLLDEDLKNDVITLQQHDAIVYESVGTDGTKVERNFISDEAAYDLIELSFIEANKISQAATLVGEGMLTGGILGRTKSATAIDDLKNLARIKKTDPRFKNVRLRDMPAFAAENDIVLKVDTQMLDLGFFTKDLNSQMRQASIRQKDIRRELEVLELAGDGGSTTAKILKSEMDNLRKLQVRNTIKNKLSPYATQVMGQEIVIGLGGLAGREVLTGVWGMDGETSELAGMVGSLILNKPLTKVAKGTAKVGMGMAGFVGTKAIRYTGGIGASIDAAFYKLTFKDTTLEDYEKLVYMPKNGGNRMSYQERLAVEHAFKMVDKAGVKEKQALYNSIQGYTDLTDRLIAGFPDDQKAEARKLFTLSFGESTGLAPLVASYQATLSNFDIKKIGRNGLNDVTKAGEELWNQTLASQKALDNFEKHALSKAKEGSKESIRLLVRQTRAQLERAEDNIKEDFQQLKEIVKNVEQASAADIFQDLPADYMEQVLEAKHRIDKVGGKVSKESESFQSATISRQNLQETRKNWTEATTKRTSKVTALRDNRALHRGALARLAEDFFEARVELMEQQRGESYAPFRAYMQREDIARPAVDMTPLVEEMVKLSEESDIALLFSPQGTFFSGALGRRAQKVFNNMVVRAFDELGPNSREVLTQGIISAGIATAEEVATKSNLEIGLIAHKSGSFNIFANATLDDAEEMRKAFRDYGYKVSSPAVSREYGKFEELVDEVMEAADKEGFDILKASRDRYRGTVGDANRRGMMTYELYKSREGAERVGQAEFGFFKYYYKNVDPLSVWEGITNPMGKAMKGGRDRQKHLDKLQQAVTDASYAFADTMTVVDGKPEVVFDLTTEEGLNHFQLAQRIMEEGIFDGWAYDYLESFKPRAGAGGVRPGMGYSFEQSTDIDILNQYTKVKARVKNPDGSISIEEVSFPDVSRMISEEKNIINEIGEGGRFVKEFEQFKVDFKNTVATVTDRAKIDEARELAGLKYLQHISGTLDARNFYDTFLGSKATESLEDLEKVFMATMKRSGEIEPKEAKEMYDAAIVSLTYEGMIDLGGYSTVAATQRGLQGELMTGKILTDGAALLQDLSDPAVVKNLEKIMDKEQIEYLTDIVDYTVAKSAVYATAEGMVRGMSTNEVLSRAYNISRGMVSPLYVGSEMAVRLMEKNSSDALLLAVQNKDAARIVSKMIRFPKLITPTELKTLDTLLLEFVATDVVRKGQQIMNEQYLNMESSDDETSTEEQ